MKRIFTLVLVVFLVVLVASCGDEKKKDVVKEKVTQEVSSEEGATVKTSDESVAVDIPSGALEGNTTITMTVYESSHHATAEGEQVMSQVVEFEPSGTIFKKPIIITMKSTENIKNKVVTAAVYNEAKGEWSYNEHGAYAVLTGQDAAGDPIMQSAAGDPIMLNAAGDPIMMSAAGDPIMMAAAGDPIMLASAGDPIMTNAAGDPIMNAAAGDPIMMTTGHFTAYTFIALGPKEPVEVPDDADDKDDEDKDDIDDVDDVDDADEDIYVPECGNGKVEEGEECDKGSENGKTECAYSETSCQVCTDDCQITEGNTSFCGDEVKDTANGEECDNGFSNGIINCAYGDENCTVCTADCKVADGTTSFCGDGIVDEDVEDCDDGANNGKYGYCNADCNGLAPRCGDDYVNEEYGEKCDDGALNGTYGYCNTTCSGLAAHCGDGNIDTANGEKCDNGENNGNTDCAYGETSCTVCSWNCQPEEGYASYCGDGLVDEDHGEACDDASGNGRTDCEYGDESCTLCSSNCQPVQGATSFCGDSRVDNENGEKCDNGTDNGQILNCTYGETGCTLCNGDCQPFEGNVSFCGDGMIDEANGEACDKADPQVGDREGTGNRCSDDCTVNCFEHATWNGTECVPDTMESECEGLPDNAQWNTVPSITQTWSGETWLPVTDGVYNEEGSTKECRFKCKENYNWDVENGLCVAATKEADCSEIPANAQWNTVPRIIQTWSGEEWLPSATSVYSVDDSTDECFFKCKENYEWKDNACVASIREEVECEDLPDNAQWNHSGKITQTWSGEAWLPSETASYNTNPGETVDCSFKCKDNYNWNENDRVCVAATRENVDCGDLPANAQWNHSGKITQTWSGEEWLPSVTPFYDAEPDETVDCSFKCKENYEWNISDEVCVAKTRNEECTDLPANAQWNTTDSITQTWSGEEWLPALSGVYNEEASEEECRFKCKENYEWNNASASCKAQTKQENCTGLPANAQWNTTGSITQTWSGEEWLPVTDGVYNEEGSTKECRFKCKENYNWNDDTEACVAATRPADCSEPPENAVRNTATSITQTWSGEEWLPSSTSVYSVDDSTEECFFKCKENYEWKDNACVASTQEDIDCEDLPDNAHWNHSGKITQTWSGEAWLPSATASYNANPGETVDCSFKCNENYNWNANGGVCVAATQPATCSEPPANAERNTATSITQTWNGEEWLPSATSVYSDEASTEECFFKCKENYNWNAGDEICVAATREENCPEPPANAERNIAESITQTWSGEAWLPATTLVYNEEASEEECRFKCKENYEWSNASASCVAKTRRENCSEPPANAEWNTVSAITQTWSGEAWLPSTDSVYSEAASTEECRFKCSENYNWNDKTEACVAATREENCPEPPANADRNTAVSITQTWSGEEWLPSVTLVYSETASTEECFFKCKENYEWSDGSCVAQTREENCTNLPPNAEWNTVWSITQTWSGEAWLPTETGSYNEAESTEECHFKCSEGYEWNANTSTCDPEPRCGDGILNGDEVCDDGDEHNGQYGFCYEGCTGCDDEFHVENGHCVSNSGEYTECEGELPDYAEWVNDTYYRYWVNEGDLGDATGYWHVAEPTYSYQDDGTDCSFRCLDGFEWNENLQKCECPQDRQLNDTDPDDPYCALTGENVRDCSAKPENSVWTDNGQHGQYIFSMTHQVTTQYAGGDTCDCCFDCAEGYHYLDDTGICEQDDDPCDELQCEEIDNSDGNCSIENGEPYCGCLENYEWDADEYICSPATQSVYCDGLPDNASYNFGGYITQTWDGEEWYPSADAFYSEEMPPMEDCSFQCVENYYWNVQLNACMEME
ncbi:DUF4215 domain-containing protein [bacterium]|nr:DUF4215 domain-containing protein [bacterium]